MQRKLAVFLLPAPDFHVTAQLDRLIALVFGQSSNSGSLRETEGKLM